MKTREELMRYAKENYPVGTKIACACDGEIAVITNNNFVITECGAGFEIIFDPDSSTLEKYKYIYDCGKWAKIISKPNKLEALIKKYEKVESKQKERAAEIARMKEQEKKLALSVMNGKLYIQYGNKIIGVIFSDGRCGILTEDFMHEAWEEWKANGMKVSNDVVKWRGGEYVIQENFISVLKRKDIIGGNIYMFSECAPARNCKDENIQKFSNGTVKLF